MNRDKGKARRDGRRLRTVDDIHLALRQLILDGAFAPGTVLSQIRLGKQLSVGRTPLREALRMLQQEGLIVAARNKRPRVVSFDPEVIEAVFAQSILIASLAARVSVPRLTAEDVARLERSLTEMQSASERQDTDAWVEADFAFHRGMLTYAGSSLLRTYNRLADENRFCLQFLMTSGFVPWSAAYEDHAALLEACRAGDGEATAKMLARHFASGALTLLAHAMPEREPYLVRAAMRLIVPKPELVPRNRGSDGANDARAKAVS